MGSILGMIDALNNFMVGILSTWIGQVFDWGIPQLVIAVLTIVAARRHRLRGMWLVSAAAILSFLLKVILALVVKLIASKADSGRIFAPVNFYVQLLTLVVAIIGWTILAFCQTTPNSALQATAAPPRS